MSCVVILTLLPAFLTLPSRTVPAESSRPISPTGITVSLYLITEVREMTLSSLILETVEISSSVIPSTKYLSLGSALRFASGRIATLRGSRPDSSWCGRSLPPSTL